MKLDKIKHFSHKHKLTLGFSSKAPYKCDGCKVEPCWGPRYRCKECNFDLHKECALNSSYISHSFYKNCSLKFLECPINSNRYCNACGNDILGFVYHSYAQGYDLHPCCANLPCILKADDGVEVELHLHDKISSKCGICRIRTLPGNIRCWSYRSTSTGYKFHVSCVKKMLDDQNWEKKYFGEAETSDLAMGITNIPMIFQLTKIHGSSSRKTMISHMCRKIAKLVFSVIFSILTGGSSVTACLIGSLFTQ